MPSKPPLFKWKHFQADIIIECVRYSLQGTAQKLSFCVITLGRIDNKSGSKMLEVLAVSLIEIIDRLHHSKSSKEDLSVALFDTTSVVYYGDGDKKESLLKHGFSKERL